MTAGEKLARWREKQSMSQTAAAALVSVSQPTWSKWESGEAEPSVTHAFELERLTKGVVCARDFAGQAA